MASLREIVDGIFKTRSRRPLLAAKALDLAIGMAFITGLAGVAGAGVLLRFLGRFYRQLHVPVSLDLPGTLRAYSCEGSPAQVVAHGLRVLCAGALPDLVVSGINYGENVGSSISASGTVGAAMEAAAWGIPALAASQQMHPSTFLEHGEQDWSAAEHFLRYFASRMLGATLPFDVDLLKLDIPEDATTATPWRLSRLSRQRYIEMVLDQPSLSSRLGDSRLTIEVNAATLDPASDIHALVNDRVVAVTPLSLDATSRADFAELRALLG